MFFNSKDKDKQISDLTARVNELEMYLRRASNSCSEANESRFQLIERVYDLKNRVDKQNRTISAQCTELGQLKTDFTAVMKENEEMHTTINSEIHRLSKANGSFRDILDNLCNKVRVTNYMDLSCVITDLVDKRSCAENDAKVIANLKEVIRRKEGEIYFWQQQVATWKQRAAMWKQQAKDWEKEFTDLKNSYNKEHTIVYRDESGHISCVTNGEPF